MQHLRRLSYTLSLSLSQIRVVFEYHSCFSELAIHNRQNSLGTNTTSLASFHSIKQNVIFVEPQLVVEAFFFICHYVTCHYVWIAEFTAPTDRMPHQVLLSNFVDLVLPELLRSIQAGPGICLAYALMFASSFITMRFGCTSH